jgi:RNA polymerase sigma-70 factor (ECF subfamily)
MIKPLHTHPHQELIKACRKNDRKAQMGLYKSYYKAMYNTANRIVNNAPEAEDIMQEAFMDAFQKIHQLSDTVSFGAWLKRIVINKSLDVLKREKVWNTYQEHLQNNASYEQDEGEDPDFQYQLAEVKEAIKRLPDQYRVVLSLHLFEGMDYEEMGQILDLEYNNVKTRYSRARRRLLEEIKKLQNQQGEREVWHVEN